MERSSLTRLAAASAAGSCLVTAALLLNAAAQNTLPPCTTPPYATTATGQPNHVRHSWPQGTTVTVIADQRFSAEQRQAVQAGFNNWANNGHGVTFNVTAGVVPDTPTRPPANTVYVLADPVNRADNQNFIGDTTGRVESVYMRVGICTRPENLVGKTAHEAGHEFGLANCVGCQAGSSIMAPAISGPGGDTCNAFYPAGMNGPRDCDMQAVLNSGAYVPPTPTPTPTDCVDNDGDGYGSGSGCAGADCDDADASVVVCGGGDGGKTDACGGDCSLRCLAVGAYCDPGCNCYTPIVVDTAGDGFRLTGGADGVNFDIDGDAATPNRLGWTEAGGDDAWLALDRDGNGRVDSGAELFGDLTPQPASGDPNGFAALAEFDKPASGGNGNGAVEAGDAIYNSLRLWVDANHNGVSEAGELRTLPALGVAGIKLDYKTSMRRDRYNNVFRYRAEVYGAAGARPGRWAYDVFLAPPL